METRCIHTAVEKNGFRLIVTMHPYIATLIHEVLSLNIDFTFKRVEGAMDEWEVVAFSDRFKERESTPDLEHSLTAELFRTYICKPVLR